MIRWLVLTGLFGIVEAGLANDIQQASGLPAGAATPAHESRESLRPFNPEDYALAFDVFMGSGDLKRAYLLARKAVTTVPTDLGWRRKLAQLAEWTGNPLVAWENWVYLFRQGERPDEVVNGILRLAPVAGQPEVAVEAWEFRAARSPLGPVQWEDIRFLYETAGKPQQGSRFFEEQYRKHRDAGLLEQAAELAEHAGDDKRATQLYVERVRLAPFSVNAALRAALLLIRRDQVRDAYALLQSHSQDVAEDAAEFWRLLGNTAWELMEAETGEMAYRRYVQSQQASTGDWSRLIFLARQRDPRQAADLSFEAYRRLGNIEHLLSGLSLYAETGDVRGQDRLFKQLTQQEREHAERDARFLVLRAQYHQRQAEVDQAWRDFRRALALSPRDSQVTVPALWFLIDTGRRRELAPLLDELSAAARQDAAYWLPFAAANHALDRYREALTWYRKEVMRNPDDVLLLLNYAEVLQRVQLVGMAGRVRQHAWLRLREKQPSLDVKERQPELLALTQLALFNQPGDPSLALVRQVASRLRGVPVEQEDEAQTRDLILGWAAATEQHASARQWMWLNYARHAGTPGRTPPVSAQSQLALQAGDTRTLRRLLDTQPDRIPLYNRYDTAFALGEHALAESIAFDAMQGNGEDADMHDRYRQHVPLRANYLQWRFAKNTYGDLDMHQRQAEARLALAPGRQLLLGWAENSQGSAEPVLGSYVPASERLSSLGLRWLREDGETQASVFQRDERDKSVGLRLAGTRLWSRRLVLDGALGVHVDSSDSMPLRVAGSEDHLQLGFNYAIGRREYLRLSTRLANYSTQAGAYLGSGRIHDFEVGHRIRTEYPDFRVRLFGTQQSYSYDVSGGDLARELSPELRAEIAAGRIDPDQYFIPRGSTTWGACLGMGENRAGQNTQEVYTRAFRPFFDACTTSNSINGGGYTGAIGIAGAVTGEDHLSLRLEQSSGGSGSGAMTRVLALRYRHYF